MPSWPCFNALGMLTPSDAEQGRKKIKVGWSRKQKLLPIPHAQALQAKAQCTLLYFSSNPWRSTCPRLCQRLYSLPHTRHSILEVKVVTETFLYLDHKHQEPKGVSSEINVGHNWHFIWRGGQYAESISVVCTENVTSNSTSGKSEHARFLAFIRSHIPTLNKYELCFYRVPVCIGSWGYSDE